MLYNLKGIEREVQELRESRDFLLSELQILKGQLSNVTQTDLAGAREQMLVHIDNCIRNVEE